MIDAAYNGWLERVRPLTVELIAVVVVLVSVRALPAAGDGAVVAVAAAATILIAVRCGGAPLTAVIGDAGARTAVAAAIFASATALVLAIGALQLQHRPFAVWSLFAVPPPVPRAVAFALVIPNAVAAALVFQAWLQTRVALVANRWIAAAACVAVYAVADRDPFAVLVAIAPAIARAESGAFVACVCAYAVLGFIAAALH